MTLDDIERMDEAMITAEQAASVIGCKPQSLRIQAKREPSVAGLQRDSHQQYFVYTPRGVFEIHGAGREGD